MYSIYVYTCRQRQWRTLHGTSLHHRLGAVGSTALLAHTVSTSAVVLAAAPVCAIVHALPRAGRRRLLPGAVLVAGRHRVVCAGLHLVGVAHGLVTVVSTIHDTHRLVVRVDGGRDPTVAAHVAEVAAARDVLGRKVDLLLAFAGDADAIRHGLYTSESPARSAVGLIADFLQAGAILCSRIRSPVKLRWQLDILRSLVGKNAGMVQILQVPHKNLGVFQCGTCKADVLACRPC